MQIMEITFVFMYYVLLIRDCIQVNLDKVTVLINHLDKNKVKGKAGSDKKVNQAMTDERTAIQRELKCKDRDPKIASRLIELLARVIDANDRKPYTKPAWLSSSESPRLEVVKTILHLLRARLSRKKQPNVPGPSDRARTARVEGKQAQDDEDD